MKRLRLHLAESIRMNYPAKIWKAARFRDFSLLVRLSMSQAISAVSIFSGPGRQRSPQVQRYSYLRRRHLAGGVFVRNDNLNPPAGRRRHKTNHTSIGT